MQEDRAIDGYAQLRSQATWHSGAALPVMRAARWPFAARCRMIGVAGSALACAFAAGPAMAQAAAAPDLLDSFRAPPRAARPHSWWHWIDGNISAQEAQADLRWLRSIGIGGVQVFEGGLGGPLLVPRRVVYMSPPWREAFRRSVATAKALGLDMAIPTSPGWSAAGGPWVQPEDAMRKLVWSETRIAGGRRFRGALPPLPDVAGPFQDVAIGMVSRGAPAGPRLSGDAHVIAFRSRPAMPLPRSATSNAGRLDATVLADGAWGTVIDLPHAGSPREAWIAYDFGAPRTVRSVAAGIPGARGFGSPAPPMAVLEASMDGSKFRRVADLPPSSAPVRSTGFEAVTARWFRLRLTAQAGGGGPPVAPGVVPPTLRGSPKQSYAVSEFSLSAAPRVRFAEEKAGFATLPDYYAAATAPVVGIDRREIVDLTGRMGRDGRLDWTPPEGEWTILRLGWSLTGKRNGPAPPEATGLEIDKLDPDRVRRYIEAYLGLYRDALGGSLDGLTGLLSDSIESGPQNWTEALPREFRRRRGYDPLPWMPALAGVIVEDSASTERFLWDWRRTISDLVAEAYFTSLAEVARHNGLTYFGEALEDKRPQLGDDIEMRAVADVPMAAMWTFPPGGEPRPTLVADVKGAASVANLYGKRIVAAESLTSYGRPWGFAPADLKATADLEMALGVNRIVIHTSPHQPLTDGAPGMALSPLLGQYFSRTETWAPMAGAWIDYLARSAHLLQQGHRVADIALFYGEEAPITALYGERPVPGMPPGHDYDFVNAAALREALSPADGDLVARSGNRYKVIQLGGSSSYLTLGTLRRLRSLVEAGATLSGRRPLGSPSLADDDAAVAREVDALWGRPGDTTARKVGRGLVVTSGVLGDALDARGVRPDWRWTGDGDADLAVHHRSAAEAEIYFVVNRRQRRETGTLSLRTTGRAPERWSAVDGSAADVSYRMAGLGIELPITLESGEATFVVLRRPARALEKIVAAPAERELERLDHGWTLSFEPGRGAPVAASAGSWTKSPDEGIRYFSGIAAYERKLHLGAATLRKGERLLLDPGVVGDVAHITVNGRTAGTLWAPRQRVDITPLVRPGENRLRISVANLWVNRLIGDARRGSARYTVTNGPTYTPHAPLRPSGLIGPVRLLAQTGQLSGTRRRR